MATTGMARIKFLNDTSGVTLTTGLGTLNFSSSEFYFYQNLFKIIDAGDSETISSSDKLLLSFLARTRLPMQEIRNDILDVNDCGLDANSDLLDFTKWLVLCKLLAYRQYVKAKSPASTDNDKRSASRGNGHAATLPSAQAPSLESNIQSQPKRKKGSAQKNPKNGQSSLLAIQSLKQPIPPADFSITKVHYPMDARDQADALVATVTGWQLYDDGYQRQHIKFQISVTTGSTSNPVRIERRYSEFEGLTILLRKQYKGCVLPPLPQKTWTIMAPSEAILNQRTLEFQLFLDQVMCHPVLWSAFELRVFLHASSVGWRAFQDLHVQSPPSSSPVDTVEGKNGSFPPSSVEGILSTTSKAVSFFSSMWDSLSKNIQKLSVGTAFTASYEDPPQLSVARRTMDTIAGLAKRLDRLLSEQRSRSAELLKVSQLLKTLGDTDFAPGTVADWRRLHDSMSTLNSEMVAWEKNEEALMLPIRYYARLAESLQAATEEFRDLTSDSAQSEQKEREAHNQVEELNEMYGRTQASRKPSVSRGLPDYSINSGYSCDQQRTEFVDADDCDQLEAQLQQARRRAQDATENAKSKREELDSATRCLLNDCQRLQHEQSQRMLNCMYQFGLDSAKKAKLELEHWQALRVLLTS